MQINFTKAMFVAAVVTPAAASGLAQSPNTTAPNATANGQNPAAAASGTSQLPERPGHVGNTVNYPHWNADMNEQQVRAILGADGYTDIQGVSLNSGTFHVKSAKLNGKKVENLTINAVNGHIHKGG